MGSAMLEQTPMTEKYRSWIDSVAEQFGGLDLCALEILVTRDGREIIMELNDCALPLLGDSQEEDRRLISELVLHRMNVNHPLFMMQLRCSFSLSISDSMSSTGICRRSSTCSTGSSTGSSSGPGSGPGCCTNCGSGRGWNSEDAIPPLGEQ